MSGYRHDDEDACQLCLVEDAEVLLNYGDDGALWLVACEQCAEDVDTELNDGASFVDACQTVAGYWS